MIDRRRHARCACGNVDLDVVGAPIMSVACYCNSCQQAGHQLATPPEAPAVLEADGGTPFVLYRKDRVTCRQGATLLREQRLTPESSARRVVATCCHSAMFLEFDGVRPWLLAGQSLQIVAKQRDPARPETLRAYRQLDNAVEGAEEPAETAAALRRIVGQ